jgi:hypothetical protein
MVSGVETSVRMQVPDLFSYPVLSTKAVKLAAITILHIREHRPG